MAVCQESTASHRCPGTILLLHGVVGVSFSVLAPLIDACVEQKFPDAWNGLFWARQVTGYLITLLYLAYFGFSCAAVHHWRSGKKAVDGTSSDGDIEMKA